MRGGGFGGSVEEKTRIPAVLAVNCSGGRSISGGGGGRCMIVRSRGEGAKGG